MNRQRLILFILVVLFGIASLWSYSAMPRFKTVTPDHATAGPRTKPVVRTATTAPNTPVRNQDDGTRLKLSFIDSAPEGFKGYRRNLFKPIFGDELNIVREKRIAPPPPPPTVSAPVPPVIVQPQAPPLAHFTFLGFMKSGHAKTIFLAKEQDIVLVKKGDTIAGRYQATAITDQVLTLTTTDTREEIMIPLVENRALAPIR
jgi:hypothetical protein